MKIITLNTALTLYLSWYF